MDKRLMNGLEALLRGAYEASVGVVVSSVELPPVEGVRVVRADSRAALEYAMGASVAGVRCLAVVDDLSAATLSLLSHVGVEASLVVAMVAEQEAPYLDVRALACSAHLPILLPSSVYECKTFTKISCNISEKYDTPVFVELDRALVDTTMEVEILPPKVLKDKPYVRNEKKYVTLPSFARLCAEDKGIRDRRLVAECEQFPLYKIEHRDKRMGVVVGGAAYQALRVACPHVSTFCLGLAYPLPMGLLRMFAASVEEVLVFEEGEAVIEQKLRAEGITCHGADVFPLHMHYSPDDVRERVTGLAAPGDEGLPVRTAAFCGGCGLIEVFETLKRKGCVVHAAKDCGRLAANIPMAHLDTAMLPNPMAFAAGFSATHASVCVLSAEVFLANAEQLALPHAGLKVVVYGKEPDDVVARAASYGRPAVCCEPSGLGSLLDGADDLIFVRLALPCV